MDSSSDSDDSESIEFFQVGTKCQDEISGAMDDIIANHYLNETSDSTSSKNVLKNKDGSVRKVKRTDYSRGPQRKKSTNPWNGNSWLQLIGAEEVRDPNSRKAKEFRENFAVPFDVFEKMVTMCKNLDDPEARKLFRYRKFDAAKRPSIPLELKVNFILCLIFTWFVNLKFAFHNRFYPY